MDAQEGIINGWARVKGEDPYAGAKGRLKSLQYHAEDDGAYFHVFINDRLGLCLREVYNEDLEQIPLSSDVFEKNGFVGSEQGHYYEYKISVGGKEMSVRYQNHDIACSTPANRNEFALFGIIVLENVQDLQMALRLCRIKINIEL